MAAPRKYPQDVRDRAVLMVREAREDPQRRRGALVRVAEQLGVNKETLRNWVKQADIDDGQRPGTTGQAEELKQLRAENAELRLRQRDLEVGVGFFRSGNRPSAAAMTRYLDITGHRFGVEPICAVLGWNVSTYYAHRIRPPSDRALRDDWLTGEIQRVHTEAFGVYGARKVHRQLHREGIPAARCTVERLMRAAGLAGVRRGRVHPTTRSDPTAVRAPDLIDRDFTASAPDQRWVADLTYIRTWQGFAHLALVQDIYSRRIVGWALATHLRTELPLEALEMAWWRRGQPLDGLVHHSDAGSQYLSLRYTDRLADAGIHPSVGSVGDSYDNALAETTIGLLKTELIYRGGPWRTPDEVELAVLEYIDWFNTRRLHSELGHVPPAEYEAHHQPPSPPPTTKPTSLH